MEIKDMCNWVYNEQCSFRDLEVKVKDVICI